MNDTVKSIRKLTMNYRSRYDASTGFSEFYTALIALNDYLVEHVYWEDDVKFPSVLQREIKDNKICKYIFTEPA